jgi:hypothetical protein
MDNQKHTHALACRLGHHSNTICRKWQGIWKEMGWVLKNDVRFYLFDEEVY